MQIPLYQCKSVLKGLSSFFRIFNTMQLHPFMVSARHVLQIFTNGIMSVLLLNKINILWYKQVHTHFIFYNSSFCYQSGYQGLSAFCVVISHWFKCSACVSRGLGLMFVRFHMRKCSFWTDCFTFPVLIPYFPPSDLTSSDKSASCPYRHL